MQRKGYLRKNWESCVLWYNLFYVFLYPWVPREWLFERSTLQIEKAAPRAVARKRYKLKNFKIFGVKSFSPKLLSKLHLQHLYLWYVILGVYTRQAKCVATRHHETLEVTVRKSGLLHSQERYGCGRIRAENHHCDNIRRDAHKPARVWLGSCAVTWQRNDENYSRRNFSQLNFASLIRPSFYCSWPWLQQSKLGVKCNVAS